MALDPEQFYRRALAAADAQARLPLARMAYWDIFPFEQEGLQVAPLRPPVLPEPPRGGEGGVGCRACASDGSEAVWRDEHWRLRRLSGVGVPLVLMLEPHAHHDLGGLPDALAAELGVLTAHVVRHVEALEHVARAHAMRIGDGAEHLHVWFFARPEGQAQLFGSTLVLWDDLLPEYPAGPADADARRVAAALAASYGGSVG